MHLTASISLYSSLHYITTETILRKMVFKRCLWPRRRHMPMHQNPSGKFTISWCLEIAKSFLGHPTILSFYISLPFKDNFSMGQGNLTYILTCSVPLLYLYIWLSNILKFRKYLLKRQQRCFLAVEAYIYICLKG